MSCERAQGPQAAAALPPGHAAFLANFSAAWRSGLCSGFGTHHGTSTLDAIGVDPMRTLTVTLLRQPTERLISLYWFALKHLHSSVRGLEPANATDYSGLLRFAAAHANQATAQLAGVGEGCAWPHAAVPSGLSGEQLLERAQRRLDSFCLVLIQVRCAALRCAREGKGAPDGPDCGRMRGWWVPSHLRRGCLQGTRLHALAAPARQPCGGLRS